MAERRNLSKQPLEGRYVHGLLCACGKRGYHTRQEAKTVIREMRRKGDPRGDRLSAYRCWTDPDYWHAGHRTQLEPNLNDPLTGE